MSANEFRLPFGANVETDGVRFRVWSPGSQRVDVVIEEDGGQIDHPMQPEPEGFFSGFVPGKGAGTRYRFRIDGDQAYPDPASRYQPEGVHAASEVVDPDEYRWRDAGWKGLPLEKLVIYELHIGTFTLEGTFAAAADRLASLADLGVNAIEVMPIGNFPGARNWGYDGVNLFAPATAYGGPSGFKQLVDRAHQLGIAVILDVVYNHIGPEGNYLYAITHGRFFSKEPQTPWGDSIDYDGPGRVGTREFVLQNALFWAQEFHVDGLRLDATHAIIDESPTHLLQEIAQRLHELPDRHRIVIAEDEENNRRLITPVEAGGYGLDAVWADDLHHQIRRYAAGDHEGYFAAYSGTMKDIVQTLRRGWYYEGDIRPDTGEPRGTSAAGIEPFRFVHCLQNHDQVGNRAFGERLHHELSLPLYRALSALLLVSPYTPLLWMGQEWAASTPFLYFTDHPPELGKLVTEGRRKEFGRFSAFRDEALQNTIPDPQAADTFERSRLNWEERSAEPRAGMLELYRRLLELRHTAPALQRHDRAAFDVWELGEATLALRRGSPDDVTLMLLCHLAGEITLLPGEYPELDPPPGRRWRPLLVTEELRFGGAGQWGRMEGDGSLQLVTPVAVVMTAQ